MSVTTKNTFVLGPSGAGFAIAYNSKGTDYVAVAFNLQGGVSLRIDKIAGNLAVGSTYNNAGTWIVEGADTYIVIHS